MADDKRTSLKSAYDLAVERLDKSGGKSVSLTDEQKKTIAEIEQKTKAKIAELEIMLKTRLAQAGDDWEKAQQLKSNQQIEIAKIREKAEKEKEQIRDSLIKN